MLTSEPAHCRICRIYSGHTDAIFGLAWSPDGRWLASSDRTGSVQIWEAATGTVRLHFRTHRVCALSVAWSPDSHFLASGDTGGYIYIWQAQNGQIQQQYHEHTRFVRSIAWSPDGRWLASGGDYGDSTLRIWEAASGKTLAVQRDQERIFSVAWSPDGTQLASANFAQRVELWNVATPQLDCYRETGPAIQLGHVLSYRQHHGPVYAVAWSPTGSEIVSAGQKAQAHVWDSTTGKDRLVYRQHQQAIKTLAWSPAGSAIATAGNDASVHVWSAQTGQRTSMLTGSSNAWIRALAWSPDGSSIAAASAHTITIWTSGA
jgi:FOG: WD40 repeat